MMDLFRQLTDQLDNFLPRDGIAHYYGVAIPLKSADSYLDCLRNKIDWKNDEAVIFDKRITTKRKVAWYADKPFEYTYSKTTKLALPWTTELQELKETVEKRTGETFNSCLLNLYHNGSEGMAWHSDGERELKKHGAIASLSFGAERKFSFKHKKTGETISLVLQHGSLLVMKGQTQTHWLHRLPPTKKAQEARVNLTFRTIAGQFHS